MQNGPPDLKQTDRFAQDMRGFASVQIHTFPSATLKTKACSVRRSAMVWLSGHSCTNAAVYLEDLWSTRTRLAILEAQITACSSGTLDMRMAGHQIIARLLTLPLYQLRRFCDDKKVLKP
jgi:hypothetical protein